MSDFIKTFSATKKIIARKTAVNNFSFELKDYTNNIPWVNPTVFSSTTSIYTKDSNRSYLNKLTKESVGYSVTNKTSSFAKTTNTYTVEGESQTASFSGTGLMYDGMTNKSITIKDVYSAFLEFKVISYNWEGGPWNVTFDIYINGELAKAAKITNTEFNMFHFKAERYLLQIVVLVQLGGFVIHFLPTSKTDMIIEIKNVVNQSGPLGIGVTKIEYESSSIGNVTYNDVLVYATEKEGI